MECSPLFSAAVAFPGVEDSMDTIKPVFVHNHVCMMATECSVTCVAGIPVHFQAKLIWERDWGNVKVPEGGGGGSYGGSLRSTLPDPLWNFLLAPVLLPNFA